MDKREYVLEQCSRYWKGTIDPIQKLPIPEIKNSFCISVPPEIIFIELPEWALDLGDIPIPQEALVGKKICYENVDWFFVIYWYLNSLAERKWEEQNQCIHSYSNRLKNWNPILWEKAWVNRICLFLRRYASVYYKKEESELLGDKPNYAFLVTHDIDAIYKTFSIRIKQSTFQWYNSFLLLREGECKLSFHKFFQGLRFFF